MRNILQLLFISSVLFSSDLPIKNQDVSPQQLQKQNTQIVSLVAIELSKNLPQKIDEYTQFVNIKAKDANLIYTFVINTGAKSDSSVIKDDKKRMQNVVLNGVCRSSKRFMDAQITITYIYKSKSTNNILFKFDIKQEDCYKLYNIR
jgi:predicted TIM-barrel fold metal-dependent hydrolase